MYGLNVCFDHQYIYLMYTHLYPVGILKIVRYFYRYKKNYNNMFIHPITHVKKSFKVCFCFYISVYITLSVY